MEIRRNSGLPGRTRSMLNMKSDASELNTPSANRECFLSCLSRWQMMKNTVWAITAITTTDGWILQCYFLFYHKQPQKWSLAFVILLARNWTFPSSSAGLPDAVSHTLPSLYGVLQGDGFRCVILSLNTDPSDFWALLRQELAYSLLLANGFLIESPQVVYLFTEVIPERWERGADPQHSLLPVLSSPSGNRRNAVSIFPSVF